MATSESMCTPKLRTEETGGTSEDAIRTDVVGNLVSGAGDGQTVVDWFGPQKNPHLCRQTFCRRGRRRQMVGKRDQLVTFYELEQICDVRGSQ